jgi:hypothetical protein
MSERDDIAKQMQSVTSKQIAENARFTTTKTRLAEIEQAQRTRLLSLELAIKASAGKDWTPTQTLEAADFYYGFLSSGATK